MLALETYPVFPFISESDKKRFYSKVAITANKDKCWEWLGSKKDGGYGRFNITIAKNKDRTLTASRVAYMIQHKIDPAEKVVMHSCDNPSCVNPYHLSLGTNKDNTKDMINKNRGTGLFKNGECHMRSRFTNDIIISIREIYSKGNISQKKLGTLYGTDQANIQRIVTKKIWKHI